MNPQPADKAPIRHVRHLLLRILLLMLLGALVVPSPAVRAQTASPYKVSEFLVHTGPRFPNYLVSPVIAGDWVLWRQQNTNALFGRNLATQQDFNIKTEGYILELDANGDTVVTAEVIQNSRPAIYAYRLTNLTRFSVAEPSENRDLSRRFVRISGTHIVWLESGPNHFEILAYDTTTNQARSIATNALRLGEPVVSGNIVVWRDPGTATDAREWVVSGYDLASGQQFHITDSPQQVSPPAISGHRVVWTARGETGYQVIIYDLTSKQRSVLAEAPDSSGMFPVQVDGDLVVWASLGAHDTDLFGYDLAQKRQFVISRAIGSQDTPKLSGRTVVWLDTRRDGIGRYDYEPDIYGAKLEAGPGSEPPVGGAPDAADARIEIVWPHGGVPVEQADKANLAAWLFLPHSLKPAACQWNPRVQLWQALNNEPAHLLGSANKTGGFGFTGGRDIPTWQVNDVDVSAARDPKNKLYFFLTLDGTPSRSNIWSHSADARTFFPQQDVPTGTQAVRDTVAAKIEIVFPHDNLPISQAQQANITAALFAPGTRLSVPADWQPKVHLWRAINQGVFEDVTVGQMRVVSQNGVTYPVWDFNDVDVSVAQNPVNKIFFSLSVEGVQTLTNIWAHGADARTLFPQMDQPAGPC